MAQLRKDQVTRIKDVLAEYHLNASSVHFIMVALKCAPNYDGSSLMGLHDAFIALDVSSEPMIEIPQATVDLLERCKATVFELLTSEGLKKRAGSEASELDKEELAGMITILLPLKTALVLAAERLQAVAKSA